MKHILIILLFASCAQKQPAIWINKNTPTMSNYRMMGVCKCDTPNHKFCASWPNDTIDGYQRDYEERNCKYKLISKKKIK